MKITQKDGFSYESAEIKVPIIHIPICLETFKSATTKDDSWRYLYPDTKTGIVFEKNRAGATEKGQVDFTQAVEGAKEKSADCAVVALDYVCYQYQWEDCFELKYAGSKCGGPAGTKGTEITMAAGDADMRLAECSRACRASAACNEFYIDKGVGECITFSGACEKLVDKDARKQVWKKLAKC